MSKYKEKYWKKTNIAIDILREKKIVLLIINLLRKRENEGKTDRDRSKERKSNREREREMRNLLPFQHSCIFSALKSEGIFSLYFKQKTS